MTWFFYVYGFMLLCFSYLWLKDHKYSRISILNLIVLWSFYTYAGYRHYSLVQKGYDLKWSSEMWGYHYVNKDGQAPK